MGSRHDGRHFLVIELVEGETLADQIRRGPIPVEESLRLAVQIAEALQAAHEKGVIHRDLKPANIKVTPEGKVKVLDFGLAQASNVEFTDAEALSNSPTLLASTPGMILGTAAYMSPEQAKGRPVDRRTDIFAFGCVLYEMLAGKRAFGGEDVSDTLAAVLRAEPDWDALQTEVAPAVRTLIQRCLAKDRAHRIADISTTKFVLSEPAFTSDSVSSSSVQPRSRLRTISLIVTATLLGAAAAGALVLALRPSLPTAAVVRLSIGLPEGQTFSSVRNSTIAISPDGTQLVYAANSRLYRRSISQFEGTPIPGSESKVTIVNPVFSPDGRSIAFLTTEDDTVKVIPVDGGTPVTIGPRSVGSISWSPEGIVFSQARRILLVSPDGGTPKPLVTVNEGEFAAEPQILPGGQAVLFTLGKPPTDRFENGKVVVQSLTTGERKTLFDGIGARYLPTGHLVYAVGGIVYAVPFDPKQQKVTGKAFAVLEGVRQLFTGAAALSVSNTGTLVYIPGPATLSRSVRMLVVTDRNGSTTPLPLPPAPYVHPRVSRDGKHVAVSTDDGREANVFVYDLTGASTMRRLTFEGHNRLPIWSGDSQRVAFQSDREGDLAIFVQHDGPSPQAERLTKPEPGVAHVPESWSPDGQTLLFSAKKEAVFSLWMLSLDDKKIKPVADIRSVEPIGATFSPDGRWIAYYSNLKRPFEAGPNANRGVYVQPFPPTGARHQLPKEGNDFHPAWAATGTELFYRPQTNRFSAVSVQTQPNFVFGKMVSLPRPATPDRSSSDVRDYDVMPDGRLLSTIPVGDDSVSGTLAAPQIRVVLNWFSELQERVPVK